VERLDELIKLIQSEMMITSSLIKMNDVMSKRITDLENEIYDIGNMIKFMSVNEE
jgi:hypothetical protein